MKYDVIIIGAGAAGLMALRQLTTAGYNVCMLEATASAGGRIETINEPGFDDATETGPEFIHGNLELTFKLLKEAGISVEETTGSMISVQNGNWNAEDTSEDWEKFMRQLYKLENDITVETFLQQYFPEECYKKLRSGITHYAEGFDLADISKASSFFIRNEWTHESEPNYRINGGYGKLIDFLEAQCRQNNATILFDHPVYKIEYDSESAAVYTANGASFRAAKIIITVSLGVLQNNSIEFNPLPVEYSKAIQQHGFGAVIKLLFQFKTSFWKNYADDIAFIISDESIPTWWTQSPRDKNLLTGWIGGPPAEKLSALSQEELINISLQSLANIFKVDIQYLKQVLVHHKIICWHNKPCIKGGYSYNTIYSTDAKKVLSQPINNIIYFAGEALYEGASQGTVEAALQSGLHVAKMIQSAL